MALKAINKQRQTLAKDKSAPKLGVLVKALEGVPFEEGLAMARERGKNIASNKSLSRVIMEEKQWSALAISGAFSCWTGTMVGYVEPGEKLGREIQYSDNKAGCLWIFPVPEKYRGKKDVALVAEHPNYTLEKRGKNRIVRAAKVDLIEWFPAQEGWYPGDPKHDIPCGREISAEYIDARFLLRNTRRVGPVRRGFYDYTSFYDRRYVILKAYLSLSSRAVSEETAGLVIEDKD